jgi:hypothetical protein
MFLRSASAVCLFAYFCCCNGKCVALCVAAVVAAALRHVKDLPLCACAQGAVLRFLRYMRSVTVVSCEHLANRYLQDRSGRARRNGFFPRLLFGVELLSRRDEVRNFNIPSIRISNEAHQRVSLLIVRGKKLKSNSARAVPNNLTRDYYELSRCVLIVLAP